MRAKEVQQTLDEEYISPGSEKQVMLRLYGNVVGMINREEGVYYTRKTMFRKFTGLSLSLRVLHVLDVYEIKTVCFITDEGLKLFADIDKFYAYGQEYTDRWEKETQLILNMEHFRIL